MANPHLEDGYTKIANEIIEALAKIRIPGEATQVLWAIIRRTYGWNKKADNISMSQLSENTGLKRQNVNRALKKLINMKTVIKNDDSYVNKYMLNKNFEEWEVSSKVITVKKCNQKRLQGVIKNDDKSVIKSDYYKRNKKTFTKEKYIIPKIFKNELFENTLNEFIKMRIKVKKPMTDYAIQRMLSKLEKLSENNVYSAIEILDQSIERSWTDIYQVKNDVYILENCPRCNSKEIEKYPNGKIKKCLSCNYDPLKSPEIKKANQY